MSRSEATENRLGDDERAVGDGVDWVPFSRIALEWLHPKRDLDPERWVREMVDRAQSVNIDTLAFDLYHGGYAIFDGGVAPKDTHIGDVDLLALVEREVHARQMRLVLMNMGAHAANYTASEYPTWRVREQDGSARPAIPADVMCLNTPYANFLLQEFSEVLGRYRLDGLYVEGLYGQVCYCDYCQGEFQARFGRALPEYEGPSSKGGFGDDRPRRLLTPEHAQFVADIPTNFVRRVREVIRAVSPATAFMPCPSWFERSYTDYRAWGRYADAITLERQWGFERSSYPLQTIGLSMQVIRAESGRPPFGTLWLAWNVDRDYSPCTPQQYRLNFAEILLYGGTPQLHVQTLFEIDPTEMPTVREMYDFEEALAPFLRDAHLVAHVGLILEWDDFEPSQNLIGYYQALAERHIPFKIVPRRAASTLSPDAVAVLVLPNVERLIDDEVAGVRSFFRAGGGVVLSYRTGVFDENGRERASWPFRDIAGVDGPFGIVTNPSIGPVDRQTVGRRYEVLPLTYYRVRSGSEIDATAPGRLQAFRGSYLEFEVTTGRVMADALDYDYSKMHHHHPLLGWYPGRETGPLVVANEAGGRCVLFAGEFDKAILTSGMPGFFAALSDAALWAGTERKPKVQITCSPTVEVATHHSIGRDSYALVFVNQTANQLRPNWVVRHVEPVHGIRIRLEAPASPVATVRSIRGSEVHWTHDGSAYDIELDRLEEYDAIVVENHPT